MGLTTPSMWPGRSGAPIRDGDEDDQRRFQFVSTCGVPAGRSARPSVCLSHVERAGSGPSARREFVDVAWRSMFGDRRFS